jgi:hypothetical protein
VTVTADVITIALDPNAVAATAQSGSGAASRQVDAEGPEHHIATDKWTDAIHSGGLRTPKFKQLFDQAGMSLNDPANKVRVRGHVGPHPQEYHEEVLDRLRDGMKGSRSMQQCREALTAELRRLAKELATEGTHLNPSQVGDAQVFRPGGWLVVLLVSEEIKEALERIGATGTKFKEV